MKTLVAAIYNTTRLWANKGYTPEELMQILSKPAGSIPKRMSGKIKIGRNDPCPCGSGKKYKKCCGA